MNSRAFARLLDRIRPHTSRQLTRSVSRRAWRSDGVEALEGRALLTGSPLDPKFNGGQPIVNLSTPANAPATATSLNSGTAVAVQSDGKIVVVGAIVQPSNSQWERWAGRPAV